MSELQLTKALPENIEIELSYDSGVWREKSSVPVRTLQLFITNRCDKRCDGCFYEESLGRDEMKLDSYKRLVNSHRNDIDKVILLGGEPTLHANFNDMIKHNQAQGLKTTVYSNGVRLDRIFSSDNSLNSFDSSDLAGVDIRLGILGLSKGEKNLHEIEASWEKRGTRAALEGVPLTVVYMLRKDNIDELMPAAEYAATRLNCKDFYISSIRDISTTQDFWKDTAKTVSMLEYASIVRDFVERAGKELPLSMRHIHIARRGVLTTAQISHEREIQGYASLDTCRFLNIFPDNQKVICPFDISKKTYSSKEGFDPKKCDKHKECLLQKIVLERIEQ